jgi:hypothetical protein
MKKGQIRGVVIFIGTFILVYFSHALLFTPGVFSGEGSFLTDTVSSFVVALVSAGLLTILIVLPWPRNIVVGMIVFMVGIIMIVAYTMTLDVNLVADDYYQQELAYEEQITRQKNTESLEAKPIFEKSADGKLIVLTFPADLKPDKGEITLYRPSDFTKDRRFELKLDEVNQQGFVAETLQPGLWRAKVLWQSGEKSYFQEFVIVI